MRVLSRPCFTVTGLEGFVMNYGLFLSHFWEVSSSPNSSREWPVFKTPTDLQRGGESAEKIRAIFNKQLKGLAQNICQPFTPHSIMSAITASPPHSLSLQFVPLNLSISVFTVTVSLLKVGKVVLFWFIGVRVHLIIIYSPIVYCVNVNPEKKNGLKDVKATLFCL